MAKHKLKRIKKQPLFQDGMSLMLPLSFCWMEIALLVMMEFGGFSKDIIRLNTMYAVLFAFSAGLAVYSVSALAPHKWGKALLTIGPMTAAAVWFTSQALIKQTYGNYMSVSVIFGMAGALAGSYKEEIIATILGGLDEIAVFFTPVIVSLILVKWIIKPSKANLRRFFAGICLAIFLFAEAFCLIYYIPNGYITDIQYMTSQFDINEGVPHFGLGMSTALDTLYIFTDKPSDMGVSASIPIYVPTIEKYGFTNVMDIDLTARSKGNSTIASMSAYFASTPGTPKSEYTGLFEGKNLILVCAESFNVHMIDPQITPTLYKMMTQGFYFTDFYQPAWGVSTSDGEYSFLMGNIPKAGVNSMFHSRTNLNYFTLPSALKRLGYSTYAYHNNTYTYYNRDQTHLNLGFDVWMGMGNGMEKYVKKIWPESDLEMMVGTIPLYADHQPFCAYYMTVSGHPNYNWGGNNMASLNRKTVEGLNYSEEVKAYIACNLELEKAMTYLIEELENRGILDDTVIVLCPDHYPYGLSAEGFDELAGHTLERNFEFYKNVLIIYNSATPSVKVDKPCYSIDIQPTLLNLFGCEYDSRLIMGKDILSPAEGLVIFRNYSWISEKGRYNARTSKFTPAPGVIIPDTAAYIQTMNTIVRNRTLYSAYILENNYYYYIFGR